MIGLLMLHPVLREKLNEGLGATKLTGLTPRDQKLPAVRSKVHTVIGMRRVGKTVFLRQQQEAKQQALGKERAVYVSFDDDRLSDLSLSHLDSLIEEYYRTFPHYRNKRMVWWFFDEVQLISGWERFVRRIMDTEKVSVVVSGSSAKLLSHEVHTSLRGRGFETTLRPFSFREFLRHRKEEPSVPPARLTAAERSLLEKRFLEYLRVGGFPEAQALALRLRIQLLQSYVDTLLLRDVVERYKVSQVAVLRWIVRHCLRNPATFLSVNALYRDLKSQGFVISKNTVHTLLEYLTDAFLLTLVPLATESVRKRSANPRKVYPADQGIVHAFDVSGRGNVGRAFETSVLTELQRRGGEVGYVRTEEGFEVDFLARFPEKKGFLIQVCADVSTPQVLHREIRALRSATRMFPRARCMLVVLSRDQALVASGRGYRVVPAYEWFLKKEGA